MYSGHETPYGCCSFNDRAGYKFDKETAAIIFVFSEMEMTVMSDTTTNIDSERYLFMMQWNIEEYGDGARCLFCDELQKYTFFPYAGKLKHLPEYSDWKTEFEDVRIFLFVNRNKKPVKVPCNILEQQKKIYISEGTFNKHWKYINKGICRAIANKNNGKNKVTYEDINNRVDLSLLQSANRKAKISKDFLIIYKKNQFDIETQRLISKRASALDDHRYKFVYARSDVFVHDKSCPLVEKIDCRDFGALEDLPNDRKLCPRCKKRIYIRNAIKNDNKCFPWYFRFFDQGRVGVNLLEEILMNGKAELYMQTINELQITYKEDTWLISMEKQGKYTLKHNNYVMVSGVERCITSGFHDQKCHTAHLAGILCYIEGYDWKKHLETKLPCGETEEERESLGEREEGSEFPEGRESLEGREEEKCLEESLERQKEGVMERVLKWWRGLFK